MHAKRDAFLETIKKGKEMGEADWTRAKSALETDWSAFEASVQKYFDATGAQVEQQEKGLK
jgi:hypothetical protein